RDDAWLELIPGSRMETLRPCLLELVEADLVRIYDRDDDERPLAVDEAVVVVSNDVYWRPDRAPHDPQSAYCVITTPAGDVELDVEWKRLGEPLRLTAERTVKFLRLAGPQT